MQFRVEPARFCRAGARAELAPHEREPGRYRALEGEDRLLLVADGEQRARLGRRAFAREEFFHQRLHHLPLARAGVLRLVDQDVLDATVELVLHPLGGVRSRQQVRRLDDEVVEIECAACRLQPLIGRDGRVGEPQHGGGRDIAVGRGEAVEQRLQTNELCLDRLGETVPAILDRL